MKPNHQHVSANRKIITSESVNIGHPDKTCDTIADSFLDEALRQDQNAQMAVECAIKDDLLMIYGEATTTAKINYASIAREVLKEVGYQNSFRVVQQVSQQSPDIHRAVVQKELCAGDQGMAYGYATNETPEFMPLPIMLAHRLMQQYEMFRKQRTDFFSDAKAQVSVEYEKDIPVRLATVLVSVSHAENMQHETIRQTITNEVVLPVLKSYAHGIEKQETQIMINPGGKFTVWGSFGDSGCVGRKIVVDTYGGQGRVGGGCFSSKNATKVDRSGAYYARYVAKNIVAQGFAKRCEVAVSFGIGLAEPLHINIETFRTNQKPQQEIEQYVKQNFNFTLDNIIKELDLLKPQYKQTACYGHFGRSEFAWEKIKNKV